MATYKEGPRASDAYRKDGSPKGLNHRDKGSPAKKITSFPKKSLDNQKSGKM